jgi:hypothetical protein
LQDRKLRELAERKARNRNELMRKIIEENQRRIDIESDV